MCPVCGLDDCAWMVSGVLDDDHRAVLVDRVSALPDAISEFRLALVELILSAHDRTEERAAMLAGVTIGAACGLLVSMGQSRQGAADIIAQAGRIYSAAEGP